MEGGGKGVRRVLLRKGMDAFLRSAKAAAQSKSLKWQIVACGARNEAYRRFSEAASRRTEDLVFLLVDSEDELSTSPRLHLVARDGWERLGVVSEDRIHLMVRTMETWLIADVEALSSYYGRRFNGSPLPRHKDLERVPKRTINASLTRATRKTQKGEYHKIRHASDLLALVDPDKVKKRCRHSRRLFETLAEAIEVA